MPWTFSTSALPAVSFPIPSAPNALLAATVVFLANPPASPAPQGQAILRSQAHLSLHALRACLPATVLPANQAAAAVPPVTTALIQPAIRRFVPQALTALLRAALLLHVVLKATVVSANQAVATALQAHTALINAEVL